MKGFKTLSSSLNPKYKASYKRPTTEREDRERRQSSNLREAVALSYKTKNILSLSCSSSFSLSLSLLPFFISTLYLLWLSHNNNLHDQCSALGRKKKKWHAINKLAPPKTPLFPRQFSALSLISSVF